MISQSQRALAARASASQQTTRASTVTIPVRAAGSAAPVLPPRAPCRSPTANTPRRWTHTPAALPNRRQMRQQPLTFQSAARNTQSFLTTTLPGKLVLGAVAAALLGSIGLAVYRTYEKANTARAKRMRQRLQRASGFTAVEVFRKYLWYLLRERKFDQGAVEDLVALKTGLGLTDGDAGEALRERSARVYDKYGTLMLNTEGLTLSGAQRKATCMALFRKIFGATREDMDRLRIKNLYEAELDLEGMVMDTADEADEVAPGSAAPGGKQQQEGKGSDGAGDAKKQ
eukprot:XP_001695119.1 predicted protein [Chlamydomonas reinhardtii]